MRHARAFRGPARSTIEFCNLVGVGLPGSAVKGRKFGDQFGDGHAELGGSRLERIRSVFVNLDADAGVHDTRIADPWDGRLDVRAAHQRGSAPQKLANPESSRRKELSRIFASWNRIGRWLLQVDGVRRPASGSAGADSSQLLPTCM